MNKAEAEKFDAFMKAIDHADDDYEAALELLASISEADRSAVLGEETLGDVLDRIRRGIVGRQNTIRVAVDVAAEVVADHLERDCESADLLQRTQ